MGAGDQAVIAALLMLAIVVLALYLVRLLAGVATLLNRKDHRA